MSTHNLYNEEWMFWTKKASTTTEIDRVDASVSSKNISCGDAVTIHVKLKNDQVVGTSFTVEGCSICKASTAHLCDLITDKKIEEIAALINELENYLDNLTDKTNIIQHSSLKMYELISEYPTRLQCVKIASSTLKKLLKLS